MGQYFEVYNKTRNERIEHNFNLIGGMKLCEHSYLPNPLSVFLRDLLANEWKGDEIYHLGDYASPDDGTQTAFKLWDSSNKILDKADIIKVEDYEDPSKVVSNPYVINETKKQYLDIRDAAITSWYKTEDGAILMFYDPLLLLTACGNGLGGGDYFSDVNRRLIGSWAGDKLSASDKEPEGYEKVRPVFMDDYGENLGKDPEIGKYQKMADEMIKENVGMMIENYGIEGLGYQKLIKELNSRR